MSILFPAIQGDIFRCLLTSDPKQRDTPSTMILDEEKL